MNKCANSVDNPEHCRAESSSIQPARYLKEPAALRCFTPVESGNRIQLGADLTFSDGGRGGQSESDEEEEPLDYFAQKQRKRNKIYESFQRESSSTLHPTIPLEDAKRRYYKRLHKLYETPDLTLYPKSNDVIKFDVFKEIREQKDFKQKGGIATKEKEEK